MSRLLRAVRARLDKIALALSIYTPAVTWTVIVADVGLGLGMVLQPDRFARTPSYGNLIGIAPIQAWGGAHIAVALGLLVWRLFHCRGIGIAAHMAAAGLTCGWFCAFIIRFATDSSTTIVNVVSWGVMVSLVARSIVGLDEDGQ
jgi:hypothetical protein